MRLNFNVVVVDNDFEKPHDNRCRSINNLIDNLARYIIDKGFTPEFFKYINLDDFLNDKSIDGNNHLNRIDFYLSDNNLEVGENKNGIDLYLTLKDSEDRKIFCDFLLYTRSEIDEIIYKLSLKLNSQKDPNLFTRFTFVTRPNEASDDSWHKPIKNVLDHIITQREEINQLRGLFAQVTARIHNKLKEKLNLREIDFGPCINKAKDKKLIDEKLHKWLHTQRHRRNCILHNDEHYDQTKKMFAIKCKDRKNGTVKSYYFKDFSSLRKHLKSTEELFNLQINSN